MKLRTLIIICAAVVLAGGLFVGYLIYRDRVPESVALADVKVLGRAELKCLARNDSFKLSAQEQQAIAAAAVKYVRDIPAGTRATLDVSRYEAGKLVAGSVHYAKGYGSYNFALKPKDGGQWRIGAFKACQ